MANSLSDIDLSPGGLAWTRAEQIAQFTQEPAAVPAALAELAAEYERRCEAFDRTVCTGGVRDGSVQPATPQELGIIGRHARGVWEELMWRAVALGYTRDDLRREIRRQGT